MTKRAKKIDKFNDIVVSSPKYTPQSLQDLAKLSECEKSIINLSKNENPFDIPANIKERFFEKVRQVSLNRYPELTSENIRQKIADFFNSYFDLTNAGLTEDLTKENIAVGNGSDELISYLIRIFPGTEVIICTPTFEMYEFYSSLNGLKIKNCPLNQEFEIEDIHKEITEKTRLVFICSPNNPTGNLQPEEEILKILETGVPVILDEAYADFSKTSMIKYISQYPNLVILRTFSKAFGLAGIRAGVLIANQEIVSQLMRIKSPYSFNILTEKMVETMLENYNTVLDNIEYIIEERTFLSSQLKGYALKSNANFILLDLGSLTDMKGITSNMAYKYFLQNGIIVRRYDNVPRVENKIRITVGTREENRRFLDCFRKMKDEVTAI